MSDIKIFEPSAIAARLERSTSANASCEIPSNDDAESKRDQYLARMVLDERRGFRDPLIASGATIKRLQALYEACPNFSEAIGIVLRAARLSKATSSPVKFPPLYLLAPPSAGKTHFCRKLASALGALSVEQSIVGVDDSVFSGHSLAWKGARAGIVARTLIESHSAQPLFVLDEIDKAPVVAHSGDLLDPLLALLEPENARAFVDTYLEIPIRADGALYVATANDVTLKPALMDRFLVLTIPEPTAEQRRAIVANILEATMASHDGHFESAVSSDTIDALARGAPRRMRMVIHLALGFAVSERRRRLTTADIHAAQRIVDTSSKPGIGFSARF